MSTTVGRIARLGRADRWRAVFQRQPTSMYEAAALVALGALLPLHRLWAADSLLLLISLTLPGEVLLRVLRFPADRVRAFPIYLPALSLIVLMASGLALDLLGPSLGLTRPLAGVAPALAVIALTLALWIAGLRAPAWSVRRELLRMRRGAPLLLLPPMLAAAGALVLNNRHAGSLAAIGAVTTVIALTAGLLAGNRLTHREMAVLIFSCALAAELAFSLRSQEIFGFDISSEIGTADFVHSSGVWHRLEPNDAYGAMLSITVLPSVLASLTGATPLILFKLVYPCISALIPVAMYLLGSRVMSRAFSAGAAALLLIQVYFFEQLAELARQEIALLIAAVVIAALLERPFAVGIRTRTVIVSLLSAGVVVAHYSTTYVLILFLVIVIPLEILRARKRFFAGMGPAVVLSVVVLGGGAAIWDGAVTHSASNVTAFIQSIRHEGLSLFPSSSGGLIHSYLADNEVQTVSASTYQHLLDANYSSRSYVTPLPAAEEARFALRTEHVPELTQHLRPLPSLILTFSIVFSELMLVICGLGSLVFALSGRDQARRDLAILSVGSFVMLFLIRFSSTLSAAYNQTRALLQSLVLIALPAGLLVEKVAHRWPRTKIGGVLALAIGLMFAFETGVTTILLGGQATVNLHQSGVDYEHYYVTSAELAGAAWAAAESGGKLLYADEYADLRTVEVAGANGLMGVTPQTLDRHAWVYGDRTNVVLGQAFGTIDGDETTYSWPRAFLNAKYDRMFDDGDSMVYHR
jgi:uncharacterized membrane protein